MSLWTEARAQSNFVDDIDFSEDSDSSADDEYFTDDDNSHSTILYSNLIFPGSFLVDVLSLSSFSPRIFSAQSSRRFEVTSPSPNEGIPRLSRSIQYQARLHTLCINTGVITVLNPVFRRLATPVIHFSTLPLRRVLV